MEFKRVLAVETSCDDTSVAIVDQEGNVENMVSASQDEVHKPFGGIVPELAGRAHSEVILNLIDRVLKDSKYNWKDISGFVVTNRPGLVGSLLVGIVTIKTLAQVLKKPFIGVNHIEGHIWAPFISDTPQKKHGRENKFLSLVVSGGHTQIVLVEGIGKYRILGKTVDDAAGEALDKFAKILGLGYPGGATVDSLAKEGDKFKFKFPRPMLNSGNFDFSFSGLKTSALNVSQGLNKEELKKETNNLCASYQEAIVETLLYKVKEVVKKYGKIPITITGGVSANSRLRDIFLEWTQKEDIKCIFPEKKFCTDNAGMVGFAGILRLNLGEVSSMDLGPHPQSLDTDFNYEN